MQSDDQAAERGQYSERDGNRWALPSMQPIITYPFRPSVLITHTHCTLKNARGVVWKAGKVRVGDVRLTGDNALTGIHVARTCGIVSCSLYLDSSAILCTDQCPSLFILSVVRIRLRALLLLVILTKSLLLGVRCMMRRLLLTRFDVLRWR